MNCPSFGKVGQIEDQGVDDDADSSIWLQLGLVNLNVEPRWSHEASWNVVIAYHSFAPLEYRSYVSYVFECKATRQQSFGLSMDVVVEDLFPRNHEDLEICKALAIIGARCKGAFRYFASRHSCSKVNL